MSLNIIFAGTSTFAVGSLEALIQSQHNILAVYTQPDRPAGRGLKLTMSPVKETALSHNVPVYQPASLKDPEAQQTLASLQPDLIVVVVYGLLIPKTVLEIPKFGCINIHPSLLPRWRGAAPIQRAIEAGDTETGVTIMQLDEGWDTGDILTQTTHPISPDDTSQTLHDTLAQKSAPQLLEAIQLLEAHRITSIPQDHTKAIYAAKLDKLEGNLDWEEDSTHLANKVRAYNSWPVAYTLWEGKVLRIWKAQPLQGTTQLPSGTLVSVQKDALDIACGDGSLLRLLCVQLPGGKPLPVNAFLQARGKQLVEGKTRFKSSEQ
ncbi:MAG: fmt [Gammaproteobacteria bacterium]|jgi:methionyl-tRNA formyltransferase|nr:fmt [Gammaproteobacteria bacterium]